MSKKHTSGPWKVRKGFSSGEYAVYPTRPGEKLGISGARWAEIATVGETSRGESARANARLISAAPDLLEALEDCQWGAGTIIPTCPQCGNDQAAGHKPLCIVGLAIAKAKGRVL